MTTLHLAASDIAELATDDDGNVTIELTRDGERALRRIAAKLAEQQARNVMTVTSPADARDDGFAAGFRTGYAHGRGPGMPPLRA
ncbi:hypothetical protein AB0K66_26845 [Streptomyces werraensis]|uniref:hypothetical protein n=1 Tax=Streptomyces werraensis TaxID=68284 RepID=UPI0034262F09